MSSGSYRPEWAPDSESPQFAGRIMPGVSSENIGAGVQAQETQPVPPNLSRDDYVAGILQGNRMILSRAITLIESNASRHFDVGQDIVQRILPHTGRSIRVGITGVPGAGKSTFIETLGCFLCRQGHRVAVLAVDPSSPVSRGSILGDKTRMENLSREPHAFIRPSPSGGTLGGVARKSRETLLLCEAAGYDVILVETVGVGQGETTVRALVDFFLVLVLTGAGDDLQGIKKGVIELADAILVHKADGNNRARAQVVRSEYEQILHFLRPATEGWKTQAYTGSALTGEGIVALWETIRSFQENQQTAGILEKRRRQQVLAWVRKMLEDYVLQQVSQNSKLASLREQIEHRVDAGTLSPTQGARQLMDAVDRTLFSDKPL